MLAKRVIPVMLVRGRTLVKGQKFDSWRSIGHAMQAARIHAVRGVDELMILDISATAEGRGPDLEMVRELSESCFIPITVGGGVRTVDDINRLLRAGADKVAICTGACDQEDFIFNASSRFGGQAIVGVVEYRDRHVTSRCGAMKYDDSPVQWAQSLETLGAGEILLTSVDRDGTMEGYDIDTIHHVSKSVGIPVIACGGCGSYLDMVKAFHAGASACASGAMFAFTDQTPKGAARALIAAGLEARV
jgi:cyclase